MKTAEPVSIEAYLHSDFQPDREYVDGQIQQRHLGEKDHGNVQKRVIGFFLRPEEMTELRVWPEQRVRVKPARLRVPDVCVTIGEPDEQIFIAPPYIVIEVLSPDDTPVHVMERVRAYEEFGVPHIWVVDPSARRGSVAGQAALHRVETLRSRGGPEVALQVESRFALGVPAVPRSHATRSPAAVLAVSH